MAADNVTLGRFQLSGIPPAPRGVPQIEVTFDIDANGIVNVSAKDLGTGKEQRITITASTNLNEDEIKKKVKEAERFSEEDKKKKEGIEIRNNADSLVYQTEKTMKDMEGKISQDEKTKIEGKLQELKKALEGTDNDEIKKKSEELTTAFYSVSQKMYEQASKNQTNQGTQSNSGDGGKKDDVVDADYEVVDDDDKKDNKK
jgi:molecular chaperone DnaK